jgi:TolA-binding protein
LSACAGQRVERGPTLASIKPAPVQARERDLPATDIGQVVAQYRAVLEVASEPETRIKVQQRLAGLEMLRSEQRQVDTAQSAHYFAEAIELYQSLIDTYPDRQDNDRLLYQMAKAHDLDGNIDASSEILGRLAREYPQSQYYAEAQFRYGELLFSQQRYQQAEQAYGAVLRSEPASPYHDNARYMRGWSLFKQSMYEPAIDDFTAVLDQTIPSTGTLADLPRAELELAEDTLRVMSLAFSYLDGADSIAATYARLGQREYRHLLYLGLGELYLSKQRYRDSADTWTHFVEQFPQSEYAPEFSVRLIDVYQRGGFPSEILPAKEDFVRRYGLYSSFWSSKGETVQQGLRSHLYQYIEELAKHYHATAQLLQAAPASASISAQQQVRESFLAAGNWYAEFAETFPGDEKTPEMVFLMGESLNEAGELPRAIAAYERVAYADYDYRDPVQAAEAGYSAILVYDRHIDSLAAADRDNWEMQKIESQLRFAEVYPADSRALPVLGNAARELLRRGNAREAVIAASRITSWKPQADDKLRRSAWLVQGHGNFDLADYAAAELAYRGALLVRVDGQEDDRAVIDRLAASVYKQAEQHQAAGEQGAAIEDFLRIAQVAPASAIAATAQYDGANALMEIQDWTRAEQVLRSFREGYPHHALAASIPAKLVFIYQQQQNWRAAADELSVIALHDTDDNVRRQSLYMAAELYQKDGANDLAIARYTDYANTWPEPLDLALESRYQLNLLWEQAGDYRQRRVWLQALISSHDSAGKQATERSRYLAAMAASVFAADAHRQYRDTPLSLPLNKSFKTKKLRMQAALAAAERVINYEVAEFATQANFLLGDVYTSLSADLLASERPLNLNALELEQYELLLEEQAYPFEEKAISIHEANAKRSWQGTYDEWVRRSIDSLSVLLPARYAKTETLARYSNDIY